MSMRRIDRFDQYKDYKHLTDNKVTVQLGLSNGTIGKSRKENRDLSDAVVEQILNFYTDLSREWLLYGEGEMLYQAGRNSQVIGNNSGTAINGDGTVVQPKEESESYQKMLNRLDALIEQNGKLLDIIDRLTSK